MQHLLTHASKKKPSKKLSNCFPNCGYWLDVRFYKTDFFDTLLQSDDELPMSEMQKNWEVSDFVFEKKRMKNYPNFEKSVLVTQHGLSC